MTISKVLNSYCDYIYPPLPPKEKPIKNIIHTWYLSNGGKIHLIRHDDKIEILTIRGEEKTSAFTNLEDIPEVFSSPEELIETLIKMDYVIDTHGNLVFTETENLHIWEGKYRDPVNLIYAVNELYFKITSDKITILRKFPALDGLSLEEQVNEAKKKQPHVYGLKDRCSITFEEKVEERKSVIDGNTLIDMNHWCVTMLNSDSSDVLNDICNPCNWMGHALLIVETIEEGDYFSRQADLIKDMSSKEHYGEVRLFELSKDSTRAYAEIYAKSETYRRPKEDIQGMINQIYREVTSQRNGKPMVLFQIDAGKPATLARGAFRALTEGRGFPDLQDILRARDEIEILEQDNPKFYNCIQYSLRNLSLANIEAPLKKECLLSNTFLPTPVLYVGSKIKAIAQEVGLATMWVGGHVGTRALLQYLPSVSNLNLVTQVGLPALIEIFMAYNNREQN